MRGSFVAKQIASIWFDANARGTTRTSESDLLFVKCTVAVLDLSPPRRGTTSLISQFVSIDNQSVANRAFTKDVKYASVQVLVVFSFDVISVVVVVVVVVIYFYYFYVFSFFASSFSSKTLSKSNAALMRLNQSGPAEDVLAHKFAPNAPRRRG